MLFPHFIGQGQIIDQANQLIKGEQHIGGVGHSEGLDSTDVLVERALQGRQARLGELGEFGLGERHGRQKRGQAAGQLRLLLSETNGRFQLIEGVLVSRSSEGLHERLQLGALQRDLAQLGLHQGQMRRTVSRELRRFFGQTLGLLGHGGGVKGLTGQNFLQTIDFLP